jgi:hypothetical protein
MAVLTRHGTMAGYNAEIKVGRDHVCDRCRNARRVYAAQFTKKAKAARGGGPAPYDTHAVIDHLYKPQRNRSQPQRNTSQPQHADTRIAPDAPQLGPNPDAAPQETPAPAQSEDAPRPSWAGRLAAGIRGKLDSDYVATDDAPDYVHEVEPDPEPDGGEWPEVTDETFVVTRESYIKIEDNLSIYLSTVGMTLEMIDPYCGPILADNFDDIVHRWAKVIGRYPKAAKFFMSEDGGTIMTWVGALQATWPVLKAIYDHHLAKTIRTENGKVMRFSSNGSPPVDATTPPMPNYDYGVG